MWNAAPEDVFGAYIRLLILSAQRKGQWLQYRPEFIDGEIVQFPAAVMKGKRSHSIPLTPTMRELIADRVFHGFKESRHNGSCSNGRRQPAGLSTTSVEPQRREWRNSGLPRM